MLVLINLMNSLFLLIFARKNKRISSEYELIQIHLLTFFLFCIFSFKKRFKNVYLVEFHFSWAKASILEKKTVS